jgi:hypothetical protein
VRIASSTADGDVHALAFRDPSTGQLAIVGHNSLGGDTTLRINLQGVQVPTSALHVVQTTATAGLVAAPDAVLQDGALSVTVAADAFFTLTTSDETAAMAVAQPQSGVAASAPPRVSTAALAPAAGTRPLVGEASLQNSIDTDAAGMAEAFQYVAAASGSANRLYVYLGAGSAAGQVQVGLYADGGDQPGELLASGTLASPTGGTWNHVDVPAVQIQADSRYWIAVLGPAGGGQLEVLDAGQGGAKSVTSADVNLASLPSSWSTGATWASSPMSAYAAQEP